MKSITEEICFFQRLCEYDIKYRVIRTARWYHTNRQFVYRKFKNMIEKSIPLRQGISVTVFWDYIHKTNSL